MIKLNYILLYRGNLYYFNLHCNILMKARALALHICIRIF